MQLDFTKMHGLGNDFVVINNMHKDFSPTPEIIRRLADRHSGIGCDQVLVIETGKNNSADVMIKFYNADGSEAGQCGNGMRCLGKYLIDNGIIDKNVIRVETIKGLIEIHAENLDAIRVNMGPPEFEPERIPLLQEKRCQYYDLDLDNENVRFFCLSMGNPHAVIFVDNINAARVSELGQKFQNNPIFPDSVNVGFLQILDSKSVKLRVYERGAGETLACGTGACAAVVAGIMDGKLDNEVIVELKRGKLVINWESEGANVWMTGPATTVYDGNIKI